MINDYMLKQLKYKEKKKTPEKGSCYRRKCRRKLAKLYIMTFAHCSTCYDMLSIWNDFRSRIHERTISLRFLDIILRVLILYGFLKP
jgi:hypothetical protein